MRSIRIAGLWAAVAAGGLIYGQAPVITSVLDPYTGSTKLCPGGQAVITGTNLGLNPIVTVGGVNAFNLVPPQNGPTITIEIPVTATAGANIPVIVTTGMGPSAAFNITLVQYAPVLINVTSGALTSPRHSSNGVAVTASTPAAPGESIVIYAIGLGPTTPVVATGALGPPSPFATTTTTPSVTLGANAPVNGLARLANGQAFFGANATGAETGSGQAFIGVYQVVTTVPSGMAPGSYLLSLTIGGASSNSISISVGPAPTAPVISAIVGETGLTTLCPGDVAILSGLNLAASPTVLVGGKAAYDLVANNGNQMTIQIPVDAPLGPVNVTLSQGGQTSAPFSITLTPFAPALAYGGNGSPFLPTHQSGAAVTAANPAIPGETISLVVYGLGATNPVIPTGTAPASGQVALTATTPTVNLQNLQAIGVNAVIQSGSIGYYQVNFVIPPSAASGGYPTSVSIGGLTTSLVTLQVFSGPVISAVVNAASGILPGLPNAGIAQGAIFILYGTHLGPGTLAYAQSAFQNTTLSGTSITVVVNGTMVAPLLYYTSAGQVAALLPSNTPVGTGTIAVNYNGQPGLAAPITVVQSNLGVFTVTSDGQGVGIVTNPDYSLVSVMPGKPCGGPYTTCGAANPGDTLILWATGLGPVTGSDDAGAGLGVAMPNIPLKLWLGGLSANVTYQGRSGCCIGEDQIVFVVPDNVPTGCAVPLAVQIGNQISNYTVMAVAPKGSRTCTPSNSTLTSNLVQLVTTTSGTITYGQVGLTRQPNSDNQVGAVGNTDYGKAVFVAFTAPAALHPFLVSYIDDLPLGTCNVQNQTNPQGANAYLTLVGGLDAGPGIKVTGPAGSQTIPTNAQGQFILAAGTYLTPGAYTVAGAGGADVGSFSQQYTIPTPPTLLSPTTGPGGPGVPVTRANGVTFTWSGGSPSDVIQIQGGNSTDNTGAVGVSFTCFAAASAGTFTIPPSVLLTLPTGAFVNSEWNFAAYAPYGTLPASGLNVTNITASYATAVFTSLQ